MTKKFVLTLSVVLLVNSPAYADPQADSASQRQVRENAPKEYVLLDGTTHGTPGEMFQYLRERDNDLAAGNPKDIVNAYPDDFENVGDLIHQKRDE